MRHEGPACEGVQSRATPDTHGSMAIHGAFIGVDRYSDPAVRELSGARRDATALWALFSDTVPTMAATLLVDAEATSAAIRGALDEVLAAATEEDTVIVSFAGHGSPDFHLVVHDTVASDIPATGIPMSEIAERFRASRARAILFVLDCCFSGHTPGRVLEGGLITRDPRNPLHEVAGQGRFLLAACGDDQVALESPTSRHGLLTKAVLEVFRAADDRVSVTAAMDAVMQQVRAEALRLGYPQTPVLLGHVEGGLILPALRAGAHFRRAFPEAGKFVLSPRLADLSQAGIPETVIREWQRTFADGLNRLQLTAVNDHGLLGGMSLLVVAPTSSGKTFIGELAAAKAIADGRKAVFLFPYKALVNEKFDQFESLYGARLGMRVVRCTGDYQDQTAAFLQAKYDLALLTYEMFLNFAVGMPSVLKQLGLVVIDEVQFIADSRRGIVVELLLTCLLISRNHGIVPQIVALSAVIGNLNAFDAWLGGESLITKERPVPLAEGVLDRGGTYQFVTPAGEERTVQLLPSHVIAQRRDAASAQDVIVPLVQQLISAKPTEQVLIFRNRRGPAEGCAKYLADALHLPPATDALDALPTDDPSSTSGRLRACLAGGTAFHSSNLTREEREVVERTYRLHESPIRVLAATTTVAAGINTPASTVILAEQEFVGEDGRPFTIAEYKNMAGRAGRLGFQEEGRAIILAENDFERRRLFRTYVQGLPEPLRSSFESRELDTWVLRLFAQVPRVARADVVQLLANTYGGYLASRSDPDWHSRTETALADLLRQMRDLGLVEEDGDGFLRLTLLGKACGRSSLRFRSAMRLVRMLRSRAAERVSAELLMVLLQGLPEADEIYTPIMRRGRADARWAGDVASAYGPATATALQEQAGDPFAYYARCKRALVLRAWIRGAPMATIERDFSPNPFQGRIEQGNVRAFADSVRFHLRSAAEIGSLLLMQNGPAEGEVDEILRRLELGLPTEALPLLALPLTLLRGEYLALLGAAVKEPKDVWTLDSERMKGLLGGRRAAQLEGHRPKSAV